MHDIKTLPDAIRWAQQNTQDPAVVGRLRSRAACKLLLGEIERLRAYERAIHNAFDRRYDKIGEAAYIFEDGDIEAMRRSDARAP